MSRSFKEGDLVYVTFEEDEFSSETTGVVVEKEIGVVLKTNCVYENDSGEEMDGGIMVKMKISNTKGVYPPSRVSRFVSATPMTDGKRRSTRGSLVSPSPDQKQCDTSTADSLKAEAKKQPKKRARKEDEQEKQAKKSRFFSSEEDSSRDNSSLDFRVQKSPNSAAKCKNCKGSIEKGALRVQPSDSKRGWYHPTCLSSEYPGMSLSGAESEFEGYSDLSEEDQKILGDGLNGASAAVITTNSDTNDDDKDDEEEDDPSLSALKAKKPTKGKAATAKRKKVSSNSDTNGDEKDGDDPLLSALKATKPTKAKAVTAKRKKSNNDSDEVARRNLILAQESDSDDEKDMPYRVEYAATGRATCKGCDERISKGCLRIANRPLFRGKPGFTVYRHLHCTVFADNIEQISDVGGWRRLTAEDQKALEAQVEESKELVKKENEELSPDELVQATFQGEIRASPPGLTASLLPFQVEGHSWMYHQEVAIPEIRGGIMADEMGMGKTLQTITTVLDNRPKLQHAKPGAKHPPSAPDIDARKKEEALWNEAQGSWKHEMEMCNVPKKILVDSKKKGTAPLGVRAGTLVVCPVIALFQWKTEIEKFTDGKALTVGIYHGPKRASENPRELLCKYDVVLTTYQVIESDFRKMVSPNKVKCPNCGGSYKIDKLGVHLKYFCGETAQRTEAQSRQRRTADRHQDNRQAPRGSGNGGNSKKKKFSKKTDNLQCLPCSDEESAQNGKKKASKTVRVKRSAAYDSDSELSVPDDLQISAPRPSRSAAKNAKKRLSDSARDTRDTDESSDSGSDSDAFQAGSSSSDSESEESVAPVKVTKRKVIQTPDESDDSSSESEKDDAVARARAKQAAALRLAKTSSKKGGKGGKQKSDDKAKEKGKAKNSRGKMTKGKKKFDDSSDSADDSSDDEMNDNDPLAGIDIGALMEEAMAGAKLSVLHTMTWWRVVLDEAHFIKSRSSQTAAAAFSLTSIHRWCLSGTPLQNRVGELYSLIRFLRIDPMAHYFCRKEGCDCKSIHYRMSHGRCQDCGCSSIQHFSYFNKHVLNPIQRAGYQGDGRRAMMKLKNEVLDECLIRRTKESRAEDMNLPPRVVNIKTIRLHPIEEDFYNGLYTETKNSFDDYIQEGTLLNNYAHIFDLLTKMRQAVDHPYLIVHSKKYAERNLQPNAPAVANGSINCELCSEPPTGRVVSSCCGAAFCRSCVVDFMSASIDDNNHDSSRCPSCRDPFTIDLSQENADIEDDGTLTISPSKNTTGSPFDLMPSLKEMSHVSSGSILRRINLAEFATSTKIEALVQELVEMRQNRSGSKALVFSQFVNMLDLIRWRLHSDPCLADLGLGVRIIHGGMNVQARDAALKDFKEDPSVRVLLMSLKAGGVALNLTVANEAYLMDPWWNPAAEMQAIDRTHRLGQHRAIRAVRFIAEGTVEERVLQLQEKKRLVFDGTVGRDAASLKMLTVDDMKALFT